MFPSLQTEITDRFTAVDNFFRATRNAPHDVQQMGRGLVFVQIYAVYEYLVRTLTVAAIERIALSGHQFRDLRPSLLAIFLDNELKAARDCGMDHIWQKRMNLFNRSISRNRVPVVSVIPHDGSHYRHTQLQTIFDVLGITRSLTVRKRHLQLIDEVVNNRNSVAHGNESPTAVGRRYSRSDIAHKIRLMRKICLRILNLVSEYCSTPNRHRR
jgi:hypothetical protein